MTQLKSKRNKMFFKKFIKYLYIVFVKDLEVTGLECWGKYIIQLQSAKLYQVYKLEYGILKSASEVDKMRSTTLFSF